jgi:anti-sigma factor RsiW
VQPDGLVNVIFKDLMESYVDGELSDTSRIDDMVEAFNEMDEELFIGHNH